MTIRELAPTDLVFPVKKARVFACIVCSKFRTLSLSLSLSHRAKHALVPLCGPAAPEEGDEEDEDADHGQDDCGAPVDGDVSVGKVQNVQEGWGVDQDPQASPKDNKG